MSSVDRICLDERSFQRAICLERKRVERSHKLFLLMLLDLTRLVADDKSGKKLATVQSALMSSIRETDTFGWHKQNETLGLIFTEIPNEARNSIVSKMAARVNGILYSQLNFHDFNQISISQYVFPEEWDHDVPQRPSAPTLYPDLSERRIKGTFFSATKRAIDVTGSTVGLVLGLPLFVLIALAIKFSSTGPIIFRQVRIGQYGKPFVFLKFRSMYADNDPAVHKQYVSEFIRNQIDRRGEGQNRISYKLKGDCRITPVGLFLRKSSLDELPQLYNVLKGEMSLVGPRPAIPYEVNVYDTWHRRRVLEAKPGITGLWQVKGRSRVTFDEMVRLDVRYAMHRSLLLDLKILLLTPHAVIWGDGAY